MMSLSRWDLPPGPTAPAYVEISTSGDADKSEFSMGMDISPAPSGEQDEVLDCTAATQQLFRHPAESRSRENEENYQSGRSSDSALGHSFWTMLIERDRSPGSPSPSELGQWLSSSELFQRQRLVLTQRQNQTLPMNTKCAQVYSQQQTIEMGMSVISSNSP